MGIWISYFFCAGIVFFIIAGLLELINISLFGFLEDLFFDLNVKKSTLRIIGRVAILLVVMGFFMPIGCNQNGFEIAESATNIDRTIGAMVGSSSGVVIWLYVLFFASLIGGILVIPLAMKKEIHIVVDWVFLIVPIICVIVLSSKLKDITGGNLKDLELQVGGIFIIIGLIVSLLTTFIASIIPEKESKQFFSPLPEKT